MTPERPVRTPPHVSVFEKGTNQLEYKLIFIFYICCNTLKNLSSGMLSFAANYRKKCNYFLVCTQPELITKTSMGQGILDALKAECAAHIFV